MQIYIESSALAGSQGMLVYVYMDSSVAILNSAYMAIMCVVSMGVGNTYRYVMRGIVQDNPDYCPTHQHQL